MWGDGFFSQAGVTGWCDSQTEARVPREFAGERSGDAQAMVRDGGVGDGILVFLLLGVVAEDWAGAGVGLGVRAVWEADWCEDGGILVC